MIVRFFRSEPAAGIVLLAMTTFALVVANSPLDQTYAAVLHHQIAGLAVHTWINDALMAVFFLQVGLEIKRETLEGELATWSSRFLPGIAALSGMAVPALVFLAINWNDVHHLHGWAIPTATDIAFAAGILTLLGERVPVALRVLLVSIAIMDDLGAILLIALFYTDEVHWRWLFAGIGIWVSSLVLNRRRVQRLAPYLMLGLLLWVCMYRSGIHATLAGVLVAMVIPGRAVGYSPVQVLELRLDRWVSFGVIPLFAFANAGLDLSTIGRDDLTASLPFGVALGLVLGKQVGIFSAAWLAVRFRIAVLPMGTTWRQLHALAVLCGIGFTMSLFISGLAFASEPRLAAQATLGTIVGSTVSALLGAILLHRALRSGSPDTGTGSGNAVHRTDSTPNV